MADTSVEDLDTDLMGLGRRDLDVFDGERLTGFPRDSGLAMV
jgi:hypothetical protein